MVQPNSSSQWIVGTVALLGFASSIIQFVWNGSRTDLSALEARLERSLSQIERQFSEIKAGDREHLLKDVHSEFATQIMKATDRNTNAISELLVRREVLEQYRIDQEKRDEIARSAIDREIVGLRAAVLMLRTELNAFRDKQMPSK